MGPSLKNDAVLQIMGLVFPYLIAEARWTYHPREFMSNRFTTSLYEIHTKPQPPLVTEMAAEHIIDSHGCRDFL